MISENLIQKVREEADMVEIIGEDVEFQASGREFKACCPFHEEDTPSFYVVPEKNFFKCFGCGEKGDLFDYLQRKRGMEFPEAVEYAARKSGIEVPKSVAKSRKDERYRPVLEALDFATRFYQKQLAQHAESAKAQKYLTERGLSEEVLSKFQVGFAPFDWRSLIEAANEAGISTATLLEAGIVKKGRGGKPPFDMMRGRIIFPIFDEQGRVVALGGRTLETKREGVPKYLNSSENPVYKKGNILYGFHESKNEIRKENKTIVVEGFFDFLALYQGGVKNVVAPMGTALTAEQASTIAKHSETAYLLYDRDAAGEKATFRSGRALLGEKVHPLVASLPEGEDPDSFIRQNGESKLRDELEKSIDVLDRQIELLKERGYFKSPQKIRQAVEHLMKTVMASSDPLLQDIYLDHIAEHTPVRKATMQELLGITPQEKVDKPASEAEIEEESVESEKEENEQEEEREEETPVLQFDERGHIRFFSWAPSSDVRLVQGDGKVQLFGPVGGKVFMVGLSDDGYGEEGITSWYEKNKIASPVVLEITESGVERRELSELDVPASVLGSEELRPLRALWQKEREMNKEREESREKEQKENLAVLMDIDDYSTLEAHLETVLGKVEIKEMSGDEAYVIGETGSSFVLALTPKGYANKEEGIDIEDFFNENPEARVSAYSVNDDGQLKKDDYLLADLEKTFPEGEARELWGRLIRDSEKHREERLRRNSVKADKVQSHLKEKGRLPGGIIGRGNVLYAPLTEAGPALRELEVKGTLPEDQQVIGIEYLDSETGECYHSFYGPVGYKYILVGDGLEESETPLGIWLRKGGERTTLPSNIAIRMWSTRDPVKVKTLDLTAEIQEESPSATHEVNEPHMGEMDYGWGGDEPSIYAGEDTGDWGPVPGAPPEQGAYQHEYSSEDEGRRQNTNTADAGEQEVDEEETATWSPPTSGVINLSNWQHRSPRGELWLSELLECVATEEEMEKLAVLRPIRMLRQGYQLIRSDGARFENAIKVLSPRVAEVRVFTFNGQNYFARELGTGIRLVGPRGRDVKSAEIREKVAESFGRSPEGAFLRGEDFNKQETRARTSR